MSSSFELLAHRSDYVKQPHHNCIREYDSMQNIIFIVIKMEYTNKTNKQKKTGRGRP